MTRFSTFEEFNQYLDARGLFRMHYSLDRIQAAMRRLGLDDPPYRVVQVVGTNGKGSTTAFLEGMARAHGLRTGLFSSPHFVSVRERVTVQGGQLPEERWVELANSVFENQDEDLTYFELVTAMAALAFKEDHVDLAVLEAGLGGRLDATTSMRADLVLFTPMGLDHEHVLGRTLEEIAGDKAGALRRNGVGITAPQHPRAMARLHQAAAIKKSSLLEAREIVPAFDDLDGMQRENGRLALAGWRVVAGIMGLEPDPVLCGQTLRNVRVPGRVQHIPANNGLPELILDGAHNPHALQALTRELARLRIQPETVVFSCLANKDLDNMAPLVLGLTRGEILIPALKESERSQDPEILVQVLGERARPVKSVAHILEMLRGAPGPILVCGSLYLLAEFFTMRPEWLEAGLTADGRKTE